MPLQEAYVSCPGLEALAAQLADAATRDRSSSPLQAVPARSISAPEKQALDAERRRASEAKFAAWQKRAPALAQKFNRQLRPQHHQVLPAAPPVEEAFPSAPASLPKASEEQWQKDYEAFMALQKAKGHPGDAPGTSLLTLSGSQEGLEAKVAKVLEDVVKSLAFMLQELAGTFSDFN
eukprot:s379_g14.t1